MTPDLSVTPARRAGDFWIYWIGQTISLIGSALTAFALPLLVFKLSGSALDLGIATAAARLPYLIFGLPIGCAGYLGHLFRKSPTCSSTMAWPLASP